MTKGEIKEVVTDFLNNIEPDVTLDQLFDTMGGCAYWDKKRFIPKAMLIKHLRWQCFNLDGTINYEELELNCEFFKTKIIMV